MTDKTKIEKAFEVAADNRKFEIEMFWRRTVVFWGFLAALFIGIATVAEKKPLLSFALTVVAFVFSVVWTFANRRCKTWQESWEIRAQHYFELAYGDESTKNLYSGVRDKEEQGKEFFVLRHGDYSLSKLLTALSDFTCLFFLGVCVYMFPVQGQQESVIINAQNWLKSYAASIFSILGVIYLIYIFIFCRSKALTISKAKLQTTPNKTNSGDTKKRRG